MTDPGGEAEYLDLEDVEYLLKGTGAVIRDRGLLLSALGRPQSSVFGMDAYPDLWSKATALGESLARNHALNDRNKRTAFEAMLLFLDLNEVPYTDPPTDLAVEYMLRLAQGGYSDDIAKAAEDLRQILSR
ncbi:Fic family protein [Kitasatospora sp. RB6PN24]|uniref:type II toxin-antitoxin system death-on-curing family toxin n=1 Tax=Kitasatospora humi TaxID=2893891 RepID=UPI001E362340|nr:Fic family protein [Kitasatospora humi]MCC9311601.1 Fic family protein [Kitasatospora humi]